MDHRRDYRRHEKIIEAQRDFAMRAALVVMVALLAAALPIVVSHLMEIAASG